jgi:2-hydroxyglutaryl-CoA dehydratase D-component
VGDKPDAGYLTGQEWEEASDFVEGQLRELIAWLEERTGRPFDWDLLSQSMSYWNKLGFLSRKFAEHGAAVLAGRYIHNAFWQESAKLTASPACPSFF